MQTAKVAKFRGRALCGDPTDIEDFTLDFQIFNDEGYVYNGSWYFEVLEFRPPYMKIKVIHPLSKFDVEYHNVVPYKD
ncbi:MAG: hypothetical protein [Caudoviricetes sp.]|nr:MAG: hypothetical protein [Caudoviricetes sp.]